MWSLLLSRLYRAIRLLHGALLSTLVFPSICFSFDLICLRSAMWAAIASIILSQRVARSTHGQIRLSQASTVVATLDGPCAQSCTPRSRPVDGGSDSADENVPHEVRRGDDQNAMKMSRARLMNVHIHTTLRKENSKNEPSKQAIPLRISQILIKNRSMAIYHKNNFISILFVHRTTSTGLGSRFKKRTTRKSGRFQFELHRLDIYVAHMHIVLFLLCWRCSAAPCMSRTQVLCWYALFSLWGFFFGSFLLC